MKRTNLKISYLKYVLLFGFFFFLSVVYAYGLHVPALKGYVNDYGGMISPSVKAKLEGELKAFEESDSTQVVILTIPSLEGEALEEYSIKVAENWKIGHRAKDNGVILLVAKKDRKLRIEVGRGLEGRLTDLIAGRIIEMVIKPRFKRGDFDGGFIAGVHAIMDAVKGEFKSDDKDKTVINKKSIWTFIFFVGVLLVFFGRFSKILSAILGAIALPLIAFFIFAPPIMLLVILIFIGFFFGLFLPLLFHGWHGGRGGRTSYWGSWGSSGGGGFDSGGFSGGGGDFGGGGASGDW
ncbi:MAG TPA: TPM domain-containing protein [Syntrophorhabdaceae bacterium]|mgnify:CR=1 FL=1|nr:TPM domain-containing protein [Syntrophorhabdaceae bacterium]